MSRITVEATAQVPANEAWRAYTTPADIMEWNAASDDWHTPNAEVDLREGGEFLWRMEARDGSAGFDFAGTYTRLVEPELIAYEFGGRTAEIRFTPRDGGTHISVSFDAESTNPEDMQRAGWQAILDHFVAHVEGRTVRS